MSDGSSPRVPVEERQPGPRPIEGAGTSTAGFAGITERGPEYPCLTASWLDYQRWFGGGLSEAVSYLPHAARGFFENGGRQLYVARVVGANAQFTRGHIGPLLVRAVGRGAWGNRIFVRIGPASGSADTNNPDWFQMTLLYYSAMPPVPLVDPLSNEPVDRANPDRREPDLVEQFDGLTHVSGVPNSVETVVNAASQLVNVSFDADPEPVPQEVPDLVPLGSEGSDGDPVDETAYADSLAALDTVDDIALLAVPDEVRFATATNAGSVTAAVIAQCERRKDRFAIVSSPSGVVDVSQLKPPQDTAWAAFYYPWIDVLDPVTGRTLPIPPTGHIAGVIARVDAERGVHKAPANEELRGVTGLEFSIADSTQDVLNPRGVNAIRDFRAAGRGIRVWGARTMSSDPEWKYVNVRRFLTFLQLSIDKGTQWAVFEPNGESLWNNVRASISDFLLQLWSTGALMGNKPEQAFFVKVDRTTMTQDDIDNGRMICIIGVAPLRPAEFVIFRIGQLTAAGDP
jgi:Bacteriophage tail sheath protein